MTWVWQNNGATWATTTAGTAVTLWNKNAAGKILELKSGAAGTVVFSVDGAGVITGAVASITGTPNQITASAATGAVTLSIPSTFIAPGSIAATTSVTATTVVLSGNGSAAAPAFAPSGATNRGMYFETNLIGLANGGSTKWLLDNSGPILETRIGSASGYAWAPNANPASAGGDTYLIRTAAGAVAVSANGTTVGGTFLAAGYTEGYRAITGATTFTATDSVIEATANTFTVNLPTAVGITGRVYTLKNTGAGVITLDAAGAETIDGAATQAAAVNVSITVVSNGANWIIK